MTGITLAAVLAGTAMPAFAEMVAEPVALLQGLDKITARVSKFEAPVGNPVRFGTLSIRVRDCEKAPPEGAGVGCGGAAPPDRCAH